MPQVSMFGDCALHGASGPLAAAAASGQPIEMENFFSRLGLDIIGKVRALLGFGLFCACCLGMVRVLLGPLIQQAAPRHHRQGRDFHWVLHCCCFGMLAAVLCHSHVTKV
jgi:hypothetical protein